MKKVSILSILILTLLGMISSVWSTTNNTFAGVGDSITAGYDVQERYTYYVSQNLSYTELNAGISGSCLTAYGSCASQNPVINRINSQVLAYTPKYIYFFPNINDGNTNNNVPIANYEAGLNNLFNNIEANNSEAILITGSHTTYPYAALFPMDVNMQMGAKVREQAIIRQIPFIEISYIMNFNNSLIQATCHPNNLGQQIISSYILDAINNPEDYTMTSNKFNVYHTCNNQISILNYTFQMSSANCDTTSGAIDWMVLKNITETSIYIERLDEDLTLTISNIYGANTNIDVYFSSNSSSSNYEIAGDGILTLNIPSGNNQYISFTQILRVTGVININARYNNVSMYFSRDGETASYTGNILDWLDLIWGVA